MSSHRLWVLVVAAALVSTSTLDARAAPSEPIELEGDTAQDLFITATGGFIAILYQTVLNGAIVPSKCRWCDPPGFDESARGLRWGNLDRAETVSGIGAFYLSPSLAIGLNHYAADHDNRFNESWINDLYIIEAATTTLALTLLVKPIVARERPANHFGTSRAEAFGKSEANASFFSGHSSLAFSLAVSSGTVASMRGYRLAPLIWATGLPVAAFTAYTRVAADAHYLSDVLTGSVVGAAIGFSMPYFLHPPLTQRTESASAPTFTWYPMVLPVERGAAVGVGGSF